MNSNLNVQIFVTFLHFIYVQSKSNSVIIISKKKNKSSKISISSKKNKLYY